MSEASNWIRLDPKELSERLRESERRGEIVPGVDVAVFMSPYDVPEAVRGFYDDQLSLFVIEFKYIEDEPFSRQAKDEHLALRIGKNSERLSGIEIDVKSLGAQFVKLRLQQQVDEAIAEFEREAQRGASPRQGNYRLARDVIASRAPQLFESLAGR